MKERHPIDDLFRKGLYDSEATPPADVWQRVVAQRSWGHRLLVGLQRRWAIGLVGAALLLAPLAWYAASAGNGAEVAQDLSVASGSAGVSGTGSTPKVDAEGTAQVAAQLAMANAAHEAPDVVPDNKTGSASGGERAGARAEEPANGAEARAGSPKESPAHAEGWSSGLERGSALGAGAAATSSIGANSGMANDERGASNNSASANDRSANTAINADTRVADRPIEDDYVMEDMVMLRTRLSAADRALDSMRSATKPVEAPYVLPHGAWWMGVQFGWNEWNGGWRGDGRLAEELNAAETWQSGWQAGFVGGRTWRSGLSVSAGIEYASLKSRFLFTEERIDVSDSGMAMVLDTTWSVNAVAPDSSYVVYTYDIAYVPVEGLGENARYNATNRYALLSIPLEASYQWNIGRWTLAPRVGAAFNWMVGRSGRTLVASGNDGPPRSVPLSDASAADRFGLWITGSVGVDVGYALDERTQVFVGGGYNSLLASGGELRPALGGSHLRLRLVREFGLKQRKAKQP